MSNITNNSVYGSVLARNLQVPSPMEVIADVSGMYNDPLFYIIAALNKGKSKQWDYEKYETSQMGNRSIVETVTAVAQSGNNLVITYVPSSAGVDPFRTNWIVLDANLTSGRVISHTLGQLTIEPNGTALSSATDFQAGTFVKNGWNASTNRESVKTEDLTYVPDTDYNFAAVSRNTKYIDLEDKIKTRPQILGNDIWYGQEKWGIQDWVKQLSLRWLIDKRAQVAGYDGQRNNNGGIFWSITNRGGFVDPANAPFALSDLQNYIEVLRGKDATPNLNIALFGGLQVLAELQKNIGSDIKYAGDQNTFGGNTVKGINVKKYEYLDCSISFMPMPEFNNPQGVFSDPASYNPGTTVGQNSAILINTNEIPDANGGSVPVIEMFHRGDRPVYYKHIPGMIDPGKNVEITDFTTPESSNTTSDKPGTTALMYTFSGINIRDAKGLVYRKG